MFKQLFCKHKWDKVSDVVAQSTFENALAAAKRTFHDDVRIPHQLCQDNRKHIVVLKCDDCGKIKKIVTKVD